MKFLILLGTLAVFCLGIGKVNVYVREYNVYSHASQLMVPIDFFLLWFLVATLNIIEIFMKLLKSEIV